MAAPGLSAPAPLPSVAVFERGSSKPTPEQFRRRKEEEEKKQMNKMVASHGQHKSKRRKCPILDSEESDDDVQADKTRPRKRRVIHEEDSCGSRSEVGDTEIDAWETSSPTSKARPAASVSPP